MTHNKTEKLDKILKDLKSFVVAFSGGVDSSYLLHRAASLTNVNVTGVTIRTPYIPASEIDNAIAFAEQYKINHRIITLEFPEPVRHNPENRCYICKKILFTELVNFAHNNGFRYVIDGSNIDDVGEYRPGLKALKEMEIRSPLMESELTKQEIREQSRIAGLPTWDRPAMACLLTRIPYSTEVEDDMLRKIEDAEFFLLEKGYPGARVRTHGNLARIECMPGYIERIACNPDKELIIDHFKKIGFRYVSLDLEGYRPGSSNPAKEES